VTGWKQERFSPLRRLQEGFSDVVDKRCEECQDISRSFASIPTLTYPLNRFLFVWPQSQCQHLSRQCLDLASALRDHSDKLEGAAAQQAADEVER
jgi:hypothetical protein